MLGSPLVGSKFNYQSDNWTWQAVLLEWAHGIAKLILFLFTAFIYRHTIRVSNCRISGCTGWALPQFLILCSSYTTNLLGAAKQKSLVIGASREEKRLSGGSEGRDDDEKEEDVSCFVTELSTCLCWEVRNRASLIFKRPVSLWKLELVPNTYCIKHMWHCSW